MKSLEQKDLSLNWSMISLGEKMMVMRMMMRTMMMMRIIVMIIQMFMMMMIILLVGSCTMKLNAAVEMAPVTWPEVGNM
jgi:glycine cleavage system protein P-like pyridoxal-binding family